MHQVQNAGSEEPQTSQAGQDGFEQHLAKPRQADPAPVGGGGSYPHLSTEDRDLIDRAIAQYAAQKNPQPNTAAAPFTFVGNTAMLLPCPSPLLRPTVWWRPISWRGPIRPTWRRGWLFVPS